MDIFNKVYEIYLAEVICLLTAEYTSWIWKRRGPAPSPGTGSSRYHKWRRRRRRSVSALSTDVASRQEATIVTQVDTREVAVHRHLLTSAPRDVICPLPVTMRRGWSYGYVSKPPRQAVSSLTLALSIPVIRFEDGKHNGNNVDRSHSCGQTQPYDWRYALLTDIRYRSIALRCWTIARWHHN